jgi:hypothetical protein
MGNANAQQPMRRREEKAWPMRGAPVVLPPPFAVGPRLRGPWWGWWQHHDGDMPSAPFTGKPAPPQPTTPPSQSQTPTSQPPARGSPGQGERSGGEDFGPATQRPPILDPRDDHPATARGARPAAQ